MSYPHVRYVPTQQELVSCRILWQPENDNFNLTRTFYSTCTVHYIYYQLRVQLYNTEQRCECDCRTFSSTSYVSRSFSAISRFRTQVSSCCKRLRSFGSLICVFNLETQQHDTIPYSCFIAIQTFVTTMNPTRPIKISQNVFSNQYLLRK